MKVREFIEKCVSEGRTGHNEEDCYFAAELEGEEHIFCIHSFPPIRSFPLPEEELKWLEAEVTRERFEHRIFGTTVAVQCEGKRSLELRISEALPRRDTPNVSSAVVSLQENGMQVWSGHFVFGEEETAKRASIEQILGAAVLYALKRPELPTRA